MAVDCSVRAIRRGICQWKVDRRSTVVLQRQPLLSELRRLDTDQARHLPYDIGIRAEDSPDDRGIHESRWGFLNICTDSKSGYFCGPERDVAYGSNGHDLRGAASAARAQNRNIRKLTRREDPYTRSQR